MIDASTANIIGECVTAAGVILVAVINAKAARRQKAEKAETEAYRSQQEKKAAEDAAFAEQQRTDDLRMQKARDRVLMAAGNLSLVTSIAVSGGVVNGNVESAQKAYTEALDTLDAVQGDLARTYLHLI